MKLNILGIIGGILILVSIALPWWTMTITSDGYPQDFSLYLYSTPDLPWTINTWYLWVTLALIIVAGVLVILASIIIRGKLVLISAGALALLAIIIFAVGLQLDLLQAASELGIPGLGLFSSGSFGDEEISWSYLTYLSFGFWLALVSAIIMLIAARMKQKEEAAPTPPPPS